MPWSSFSECWALSQLFHSPLSLSSRGFLVPLCFLLEGWCHLPIWGYWCFSLQSWFQLVLHPAWHFAWCTLVAQMVKRLPAKQETWVWSPGLEAPLEKEMVTHSSTLAWKIPWIEEPGRLQSMGLQRVRHNWATSLVHSAYKLNEQGDNIQPWHTPFPILNQSIVPCPV